MHNSLYDLKLFGKKVYKLRQLSQLTQTDIRLRTGLHEQTLRRIEYGETFPALETLEKISTAIGYNLIELLNSVKSTDYSLLKDIYDDFDHLSASDELKDIPKLIQKIDDFSSANHIYGDIFNKKKDQLKLLLEIGKLRNKTDAMHVINTEMLCIEALTLSHVNFNATTLNKFYFTPFESRILLTLAFSYLRQKKDDLAITVIDYAVHNIKLHLQINPDLTDLYVHALVMEAYMYFVLNNLDKVVDICNIGIEVAKKNYSMKLLPHLYFRRGITLFMGQSQNYKKDLKLCISGFQLNGMESLAHKYKQVLASQYKIYL